MKRDPKTHPIPKNIQPIEFVWQDAKIIQPEIERPFIAKIAHYTRTRYDEFENLIGDITYYKKFAAIMDKNNKIYDLVCCFYLMQTPYSPEVHDLKDLMQWTYLPI